MNTQEQIGKLQGLLARIRHNAAKPRVAGAPVPAAPVQTYAAPAAPTPAPPVEDSVDELLNAAPPPVVDVDVSLDSFAPPPVEAAAAPSEAPDAEPIPLVAVAAQPSTPEAEEFSLESEVSEVRMATGPREPAAEVTVAAIEAEAEPLGTEELSEDDLVEVTEGTPLPPEVTTTTSDVDIDFEDEDEQPPASSQRSKVATTMDEALAAAAAQIDAEHEVPIKTPPPESGPQEAPPAPLTAPAAPDVDALLGSELDIPTREVAHAVPTPEQLGQTIDLEEARGPSLELEEHRVAVTLPEPVEELEVALPGREPSGGYDDNLQPPPEARDDLEAHRRRLEDDIPPPPESLAQLPSVQPAPEVVPEILPPARSQAPEVVVRAAPAGSPETFSTVREPFHPRSFVELLDASLSLGGE